MSGALVGGRDSGLESDFLKSRFVSANGVAPLPQKSHAKFLVDFAP